MRLYIAEKPSVGQNIADALGGGKRQDGYIECGNAVVTWCFGHLFELAEPDEYLPDELDKKQSSFLYVLENEYPHSSFEGIYLSLAAKL